MSSIRNGLRGAVLAAGVCLLFLASACSDSIEPPQAEAPATPPQTQTDPEASAPQQAQIEQPTQPEPPAQPEQPQPPQEQPSTDEPAVSDEPQAEQSEAQPSEQQTSAAAEALPTFLPRDAAETAEGIPIIRDARTSALGPDWATEWGIRIVPLDELSRGAFRDGIPALTGPAYVRLDEAAAYYDDGEPLVQIVVNGDARGYPLEILTWHEIVNDVIGGVPVAVTFCPLCNTAIAFESQIGETIYKFGVSGLLRNSDLVMFDRQTESLWQQSSGRAIVGRMVGARLAYLPASVVSLGQLREAYPAALILSRETGHTRSYGANPYAGYDNTAAGRGGPYSPFFDRDNIDPRLHPAERVAAIEGTSGAAKAYAWSALQQEAVIHDTFDGVALVVFWTPGARSALDTAVIRDARDIGATAVFETSLDGRTLSFTANPADGGQTFIDDQTGSVWDIFGRAISGELAGAQLTRVIHSDHFWFAWQAFHPATELVTLETLDQLGS